MLPKGVHVGVDQNLNEWKKEVEDEPNVDHLDVRSFGQVVGDVDEHGGQYEHGYKIRSSSLVNISKIPVRLTVTTASKKNGLKKLVAWPMTLRRTVGR